MVSLGRKQRLAYAVLASIATTLTQATPFLAQTSNMRMAAESEDTPGLPNFNGMDECVDLDKACHGYEGPIDGPEPIPIPVKVQCRTAYKNIASRGSIRAFRVFMSPMKGNYSDWCEVFEMLVKDRCGKHGGKPIHSEKDVGWVRCGADTANPARQRGAIALFTFDMWNDEVSGCVAEAIAESVPETTVDWLRTERCWTEVDSFGEILEIDGKEADGKEDGGKDADGDE